MTRPLRLLLALLLVAATGYQLGSFTTAVAHRTGLRDYAVDPGPARWLSSDTAGSTAWFRTVVALPQGARSATLWLDAEQVYTFWVNGRRGPTNRDEVKTGATPRLHAIDVTANLTTGTNVLAVQVANTTGGRAALIARLVVERADGTTLHLDSTPDTWRASSDGRVVGGAPGTVAAFTTASYSDASWPSPRAVPPVRSPRALVPQQVIEQPLNGTVVTGAAAATDDLTFSTTLDLSRAPAGGWLRLASRGAVEVTANGSLLYERTEQPTLVKGRVRPALLWLLDVGRLLHAGSNTLVVHVHGSQAPALYLDGQFPTPGGDVPLPGLAGWHVVSPDGSPAATMAPPLADTWPQGFVRQTVGAPDRLPRWMGTDAPRTYAGLFVAAWLLACLALGALRRARTGGAPSGGLARSAGGLVVPVSLAVLPLAAGLVLVRVLTRFVSSRPPFPYSESVLGALIGLLALGIVAVAVDQARHRPGPGSVVKARAVRFVGSWSGPAGLARALVVALAVGSGMLAGVGLGRQPLWQDEVTSIVAADSIRAHGVPRLPSGLYYVKGELYHYLLALVRTMTENVTAMRAVSVVWFAATVLAFGLLLLPTLAPRRPVLQVLGTALFATAPMETVWSHDVRMYQQMQFFAVVFIALFIRALTHGTRRQVVGSCAALLAMYLSHEESFVLLPMVPVLLLVRWRTLWWRRRDWWLSLGTAAVVIGVQYTLAQIHPPEFGSDLSNRPYVGYDPAQGWYYYTNVFFRLAPSGGTLGLVSCLALLSTWVAVRRRDTARVLAGLGLVVGVLSLSLLFTVKIERYTFVLLPLLFALAAVGAADAVGVLRTRLAAGAGDRRLVPARALTVAVTVVALTALTASLGGAPRDYGVAAAEASGGVAGTARVDYAPVSAYIRSHWQPGDVYVTLCPPDMPAHYLQRTPDAVVQTGRNKLLYAIENRGHATDTIFGSRLLLTGSDVASYLQQHGRVWLVTDTGSYARGVPLDVRSALARGLLLQSQSGGATAYLWTG